MESSSSNDRTTCENELTVDRVVMVARLTQSAHVRERDERDVLRAPIAFERRDGRAVYGTIQHDQVGVDVDDSAEHIAVVLATSGASSLNQY